MHVDNISDSTATDSPVSLLARDSATVHIGAVGTNVASPLPTADCKGDVVLYVEVVKKSDGNYLHIRDIDMKVTISGYHVRLDNLFNGDRFLGNGYLPGLEQNAT